MSIKRQLFPEIDRNMAPIAQDWVVVDHEDEEWVIVDSPPEDEGWVIVDPAQDEDWVIVDSEDEGWVLVDKPP